MKFGLSIRSANQDFINKSLDSDKVDFVEVAIEDFIFNRDYKSNSLIEKISNSKLISIHSYSLSILDPESMAFQHLNLYSSFIQKFKAAMWSDHFTITSWKGKNLGSLTPGPTNNAGITLAKNRIQMIHHQDIICPFILENSAIPFIVEKKPSTLCPLFEVTKNTDCGVLLDLSNLVANEINFNINIEEELEHVDWCKVKEIHLAGGEWDTGFYRDTHGSPVNEKSWQLFKKIKPFLDDEVLILIEREQNHPDFSILEGELDYARSI